MSKGIAALDAGDKAEAKKELAAAKRFDPGNAVAQSFLDKLTSASAKFKVVPERYVSYYNPAYLGGMTKDRAFFDYYNANVAWGLANEGRGDSSDYWLVLDASGDYGDFERQLGTVTGYQAPLGPVSGVGVEINSANIANGIQRQYAADMWMASGNDYASMLGGMITLGARFSSTLSLGLGVSYNRLRREYYSEYIGDPPPEQASPSNNYWLEEYSSFGGLVAAALNNPAGDIAWDIVGSWSNERMHYFDIDPDVLDFVEYGAPLYIEQTLTWTLNDKSTFLALKQANDIFLDRDLYYGRLMPCAEQWFWNMFSLRLGAEGSLVARGGSTELGWGATAGITARIWKFELDANYTIRQRPSRTLAGVTIPEYVLFVTLSANGLLFN
ncbi:MAG: hypothetical protein KKA67_01690 [Spirochaetes bacterium]|nr:hypothetical protein [Spirochaetota bacterium]MBU1080837.1 hypothetical protein [Spirochaetota bacterium]